MKSFLDDPTRCRWCSEPSGADAPLQQGGKREWTCPRCNHLNSTYQQGNEGLTLRKPHGPRKR